MEYRVQFTNNTLTLPSIIWLRDFLVKHKGTQDAHKIVSIVQSGKTYQDKEFKITIIKGERNG